VDSSSTLFELSFTVVGPDNRLQDMMRQISATQGVRSYSVSCDSDDRGTVQAPSMLLCLALLQAGVLLMGDAQPAHAALPAEGLSGAAAALGSWGGLLHLGTYVAATVGIAALLVVMS
jgi:hypothetical protein